MDRDHETQRTQGEAARSRALPRRPSAPSLGEWSAEWAQNHRTLSRVAAWCLGILAVAWVSTAGVDAVRSQWGTAMYFAATAAASAFVCWWLSRHS